ncbi:MAG: Hsp20/alpha crystallin family protein [Mucilaginibacter polytrichastri]|nr:Hsp20/alpha crystallin family protein [Mucilaginibacter polytrichastri]
MTLVKFNNKPEVSNRFNHAFDSFFNDVFFDRFDRVVSKVPAVNIAESENGYHVELAAPGLSKEDFKISLDKNVLTVSAQKKAEEKNEQKKYSKWEYSYSSFSRSFNLPDSADANSIDAEYVNGILKLDIAKKEEAKQVSREINIR